MNPTLPIQITLPEGFLEEETRCGYTIPRDMKAVWAVELDLLVLFQKVCKEHNIRYFASGGTMLGAVRHQGFIPWDDDIDLMMMRNDYDKLCEIAKDAFRPPYFFQTEETDPGSLRGHAVLKNSLTTGALRSEIDFCTFNMGIGIDIFPLDSVTDDRAIFEKQCIEVRKLKKRIGLKSSLTNRYAPNRGGTLKRAVKRMGHALAIGPCKRLFSYEKEYQKLLACCTRFNDQETKMISSLGFQFDNRQHFKFRKDYEELILAPFEFLMIPIGKRYDHALKRRYGDYMTYEIGTASHGTMLYDPYMPYTEYQEKRNSNEI